MGIVKTRSIAFSFCLSFALLLQNRGQFGQFSGLTDFPQEGQAGGEEAVAVQMEEEEEDEEDGDEEEEEEEARDAAE